MGNSPINWVDPDGRFAAIPWAIACAGSPACWLPPAVIVAKCATDLWKALNEADNGAENLDKNRETDEPSRGRPRTGEPNTTTEPNSGEILGGTEKIATRKWIMTRHIRAKRHLGMRRTFITGTVQMGEVHQRTRIVAHRHRIVRRRGNDA